MTARLAAIYTPPEQAISELNARHSSLSPSPSDPLVLRLINRPAAVLFRHIATPNFELEHFVSLATGLGLAPLVLEFHGDRFLTRNPSKCAFARLGFGTGSSVRHLSVLSLPSADGIPLRRVTTSWGQPLVAFHHELLAERDSLHHFEHFDTSDWLTTHGTTAREFYPAFLAIFIRYAILFESFLLTSHEHQFTSEVVIPAFESVCFRHGQRPLICRLDPAESEGHAHWLQYPDALREFVADKLSAIPKSL